MSILQTGNDLNFFGFAFEGYKAQDQAVKSDDGNITYFGLMNRMGEWYIMRQAVSGTTFTYRFTKGDSGYSTAWAAREALSYEYFDDAFD